MTAKQFRDLMEHTGRRMYFAALRIVGSEADAQDAVQEAMCRLWKSRGALASSDNPEGYATSTACRCALDLVKARHKSSSLEDITEIAGEADASEQRESVAIIMKIVDSLPSPQREVITLRDLRGLEMEEIEKKLNLTAINARVILSRARAAVRKQFMKYD